MISHFVEVSSDETSHSKKNLQAYSNPYNWHVESVMLKVKLHRMQ